MCCPARSASRATASRGPTSGSQELHGLPLRMRAPSAACGTALGTACGPTCAGPTAAPSILPGKPTDPSLLQGAAGAYALKLLRDDRRSSIILFFREARALKNTSHPWVPPARAPPPPPPHVSPLTPAFPRAAGARQPQPGRQPPHRCPLPGACSNVMQFITLIRLPDGVLPRHANAKWGLGMELLVRRAPGEASGRGGHSGPRRGGGGGGPAPNGGAGEGACG